MQVSVRGCPWVSRCGRGRRGWAVMEPQGPQLTPWGSLRAEITFRVVPSWVERSGLSPGLGQPLGVGFLWKEVGPWVRQLSSAEAMPRGPTAVGHLPEEWPTAGAVSSSFLRGMLGSPSPHSPSWIPSSTKSTGSPPRLWPLTGPASPLSPLAPQHRGSLCSEAQLPVLKRPDGHLPEGSDTARLDSPSPAGPFSAEQCI